MRRVLMGTDAEEFLTQIEFSKQIPIGCHLVYYFTFIFSATAEAFNFIQSLISLAQVQSESI